MRHGSTPSTGLRRARLTGVLLVALVMVPGLILGWMAIRAADREEAVIEKQLRTALLAEIAPAADRVAALLETLQTELETSAPDSAQLAGSGVDGHGRSTLGTEQGRLSALDTWAESAALVSVPFLFQRSTGLFQWPREGASSLLPTEEDFLELNRDFFQDRKSMEVYQNVALQYADEAAARMSKRGGLRSDPEATRSWQRQQALSEFERNSEFRNKLYDEAEKKGQNVVERSDADLAVDGAKSNLLSAEDAATPSPFVTESLRFSQIVAGAERGWIPRLLDDRLMLLYWKRLDDGRILGCAIDEAALRERVLAVLPVALTPARVLVTLDQAGRPLFDPDPGSPRMWRAPFVSREISEFLPRWEVAAYLTDPEVIADRARARTLAVWLLVGILAVSIVTGGIVVSRMLGAEFRLAEQKTTFVANVSHELKTPLTSIRLLSEMLRDGKQKDEEKQRQYLDIVVAETERLTRLINNVLDFSRLHRGGRQYALRPVDLVPLLREFVEAQMVRLTHAGFTVESAFEPGEAWTMVDAEAVKQALLNLISNAEKYSPDEKWIRVGLRLEGRLAVVSVADHGVGIRPRDAGHVFEEFYRADDSLTASVGGTGLGLTLSRRLVEDQGGTILYTPNDPKGSVFEVRLPIGNPSSEFDREMGSAR